MQTKRLDKLYNEYLIVNSLKTGGKLSIPSIAALTGLSRPTVDTIVSQLEREGMVEPDGFAQSVTGRKPVLWRLRSDSGYFVGVDFEPPVVRLLILNMCRETVFSRSIQFPQSFHPDEVLKLLASAIRQAMEEAGAPLAKLRSISVGNPGSIDKQRGLSVAMHNCPDWSNVPICERLAQEFGCETEIENVILYMANVERERLAGQDVRDFVYVALRTGVGAGVCLKGELYSGASGNAGHFGFLSVGSPLCRSERRLEEYADTAMLLRRMREEGLLADGEGGEDGERQICVLAEYVRVGNPAALAILEELSDFWAYGLSCVINLLNIPLYVVGGLLARMNVFAPDVGSLFLDMIQKCCVQNYLYEKKYSFELCYAKDVPNAAALGGALRGYETFFKRYAPSAEGNHPAVSG